MQDIALPVRLGPTTLTARIGAGGMGVVYYGLLGPTPVAVKVMRAELSDAPEFRARFRREIELMRRVRGLCTARVFAADPDWYPPYLATEYLAGPTLADWLARNGPLTGSSLRALAVGLAEALLAIHRAGVVHRDFKPGNVLLTYAGPKVVDFGIAYAADVATLTRSGTPVGTPGYMSPEQLTGLETVGPAADVFAWACTVGYAATGRAPFGEGPADAVLFRVRHDPAYLAGVPDDLLGLLGEALSKDPAARPDAAELLRRLLPALLSETLPAWSSQPGILGGAPPWADRGDEEVALTGGVAAVLDRHWTIRAYLPHPAGAAAAPAPVPPPAAPPVPAVPAQGSTGPMPARPLPVPWPAPQWPPPAGSPSGGTLPLLGRPAVPARPAAVPPAPVLSAPTAPRPAMTARPPMPGPQPVVAASPPGALTSHPGASGSPPLPPPPLGGSPRRVPRSRTGLLLSGAALVVLLAVLAAAAMLVSRSFDSGSGVPGATAVSAPAPSAAASAPEPLGAAETPKSENSDDGRSTAGTVSMVGPCAYTEDTATGPVVAPPPASATLPPAPSTMVISTSAGDLVVNLSGAAPCAVHALRHLADAGYFDGSACPREFLGDSQDPPVLQCGDPTGSGSGAPGFSYPAETTSAYPFGAGVVAVAHLPGQRPARAGAQFVIGLAEPSSAALARAGAQYTVIGQLDTDSRAVLDLLAGPGIVGNGTDGPPASGATIQKVTFAG